MAFLANALFVAFNSVFLGLASNSAFADQLKAKPGEDVLLQCQAPKGAIRLLEWIRPDLQHDGNVFFYRNNRAYENYQHQSFRGRVELTDSQMKDGDTSVILKNVSIRDTGTYICRIIVTERDHDRTGTEFTSSTNLTVTDSWDWEIPVLGGGAGHTEDGGKTDKIITNGESKDVNVGLCVGLSFFVLLLCLVAFMIIRKRKNVKETFYQLLSQRTGEHSHTDKSISSSYSITKA